MSELINMSIINKVDFTAFHLRKTEAETKTLINSQELPCQESYQNISFLLLLQSCPHQINYHLFNSYIYLVDPSPTPSQ
ncbi:Hypothetical predicted protein [Octopus vulgaris]|uniref:Uncharacterized protein n=1 Tax=Octopus vulgaris TaxID=6645 RepID=A0AA36AP13_OCTVU|nr:Hypothetical predicted protein [Octopus vulgaris]